ncbi:MAG: tetratricopeptide repeat protein [Candidatus Glassbacteria bacterium]
MKNSNRKMLHVVMVVIAFGAGFLNCGESDAKKNQAMTLLEKSRDLVKVRQYNSAQEILEHAIQLYPGSFEIHRDYIKLLMRKGDDKARNLYETLIENNPRDPLYHLCMSLIEDDIGLREKRINDALELAPSYYWAVLERARLMMETEKYAEAIGLLEGVTETETYFPERQFLLARAYQDYGKPAEAVEILEAIVGKPFDESVRSEAYEELFELYWREDKARAMELAESLLGSMKDPFYLSDMGYAMSESEYIEESIRFFESAIAACDTANLRKYYTEASPEWLEESSAKYKGFYGEGLGQVLYELGRYDEAILVLEEARSKLSDPLSEMLYTLANSYARTNREEEAIDILIELLSKQTDNDARSMLDSLYIARHGSSSGLAERIEGARKSFWKQAPDFIVTADDGAQFSLDGQKGKVVLLAFWFPT